MAQRAVSGASKQVQLKTTYQNTTVDAQTNELKRLKSEMVKSALTIIIIKISSCLPTVKLVGCWELKLLNVKLMKSVFNKQPPLHDCTETPTNTHPPVDRVHRWALSKAFPFQVAFFEDIRSVFTDSQTLHKRLGSIRTGLQNQSLYADVWFFWEFIWNFYCISGQPISKRCGGSGKGIRLENWPELAIVQSVKKQ